ncbi:MAG TPA: TonB-dependent receptor [Edaphobacter sp.]|nr:TonB-dependent receptor [Edaphobacter sp.]
MKRILYLPIILLFSIAAMAQTTSRIAGVVTDSSGAVVPGAAVTAIQESTHVTYNTKTGSKGEYVFDSLQVGKYTIRVTSPSFKTFVSTGNVLSIGLPTTVNAVLGAGSSEQTVEVQGGYDLVQTESSGNFGGIIDNVTLTQLPIVGTRGRNPLGLVSLIPGVVNNGANATGGGVSVNGSRDRAWNYMLDGVDINESSAGGADSSPVHLNPDMLSEFRVITSNFTPEYGRNSGGQVVMVTRSGSNNFHGNAFEFYQSPFLRANNPENKGTIPPQPRGQFVQHIYGGSLGGPIIKDKLFFFVNVEMLYAHQSELVTRSVYTASARQGLFRYANTPGTRNNPAGSDSEHGGPSVDINGNPIVPYGTYDMVANDAYHIGLDPAVQKFLALTPLPNNYQTGDGLNFAGYSFVAPATDKQVDTTYKIDYVINDRNSIFGRWYSGHQNTYADAVNGGLQTFPGAPAQVNTFRQPRNLALGYRATITPNTTNELLVGMNRFGYVFENPALKDFASTPFNFNLVDQPRNTYFDNNRYLTTYQLIDNFTWVKNAHTFKAGINFRYGREIDHRGSIGSLDAIPQVNFSASTNPLDPNRYNTPDPNSGTIDTQNDLPNLDSATNDLLGRIGSIQAGYVSNSDGSAFKPAGSINIMDTRWPEYDFYFQDSWKLLPNLVIDYGVRLDARMAPRFKGAPGLVPSVPLTDGQNAGADFSFVPGKYYNDDWNNIGPSVGFAWDPYKNGKTSVRGNFRIAYDRINSFSFSSTVFQGMPGLTYQVTDTTSGEDGSSVGMRAQNWQPPVPGTTPIALRTPPPYSLNSLTVADPRMKTPAVAMWGFSVQQELARDTVLTISYIGNHGTALYGGYNSNQTEINSNGFLDAFKTIQAGGDSPLMTQIISSDSRRKPGESGAAFIRRNYNSTLNLNNVAGLANSLSMRLQHGVPLVVSSGLPATFFKPYSQYLGGLNVLQTRDYSRYNGLQVQIEKRFSKGMLFQANYVWSKSEDVRSFDPTFTTVSTGSSQSAAATPFDYRHPRLNYAPSDFDNTNTVAGNFVYDLPFGRGKWIGNDWNRAVDAVVGGWEISGDGNWYSGRPITFYSGSNTFSGSVQTPASCTGCSPKMGHIHLDPTSHILTYLTPEQKAKFYVPAAGEFSNLGRNYFRQAAVWNVDATLSKNFTTWHEQYLQLRLEAQNLANTVSYDTFGSQSIQSSVFGRLNPATDGVVSNSPRRMQLSAKYVF